MAKEQNVQDIEKVLDETEQTADEEQLAGELDKTQEEPSAPEETVEQAAADEEPPAPNEEEPAEAKKAEPEPKAEKKVVPEGVFLEQKRRRLEAERELAELKTKAAQAEELQIGPTSIKELIASGELTEDDIPTAKQLSMLETNRQMKQELFAKSEGMKATSAAEAQFRSTITEQQELAGFGVDDVCTQENAENLTGKDWREFYALPKGSVQRAEFLYNRCIERTPELKAKLQIAKKTKPKLPGTNLHVPKARSGAAKGMPTQNDILAAVRAGRSEDDVFKDIGV